MDLHAANKPPVDRQGRTALKDTLWWQLDWVLLCLPRNFPPEGWRELFIVWNRRTRRPASAIMDLGTVLEILLKKRGILWYQACSGRFLRQARLQPRHVVEELLADNRASRDRRHLDLEQLVQVYSIWPEWVDLSRHATMDWLLCERFGPWPEDMEKDGACAG